MSYGVIDLINIVLVNGLLPDSTKPLTNWLNDAKLQINTDIFVQEKSFSIYAFPVCIAMTSSHGNVFHFPH